MNTLFEEKLNRIEELLRTQNLQSKEILSLDEASLFLGLSKSAMYKLTSKNELPFYSPGGKKLYFKKTELENWVYQSKVPSVNEMLTETQAYLTRTSKTDLS